MTTPREKKMDAYKPVTVRTPYKVTEWIAVDEKNGFFNTEARYREQNPEPRTIDLRLMDNKQGKVFINSRGSFTLTNHKPGV